MKYIVTLLFCMIAIGMYANNPKNTPNKVYVITYNPFNTQEDIGYIEEYEDDIEKSITILNTINLNNQDLRTEGNILFLTVLYQESLSRNINQEFEESMAFIEQKVNDCLNSSDCSLLKDKLTKNIKKLESKLGNLNNPHGKRQDMTFFKEYHRSGKKVLGRIYNQVEMISVSNGEEFTRVYSNIEPGSAVMIMDHAGNRVFGMRAEKFIDVLSTNPPAELILGICRSYLVVDKIKNRLPSTTLIYTDAKQWKGFDSREQSFDGVFPNGYIRK